MIKDVRYKESGHKKGRYEVDCTTIWFLEECKACVYRSFGICHRNAFIRQVSKTYEGEFTGKLIPALLGLSEISVCPATEADKLFMGTFK